MSWIFPRRCRTLTDRINHTITYVRAAPLPQKFRLIVRIDEDVKQLREKMQAEAQQKAELYSM